MQDELRRKMLDVINQGITDEPHLVYFFVEARKLMDRDSTYLNIHFRMFANWVVHISLTQERRANRELLQAFEQEYANVVENGGKWRKTPYEDLSMLKNSVRDFLGWANLPTDLIDQDARWYDLANLYLQVVSDCPITLVGFKLKYIKQVELVAKPGLQVRVNGRLLPGVNWRITPHSGKSFYRQCALEAVTLQLAARNQ